MASLTNHLFLGMACLCSLHASQYFWEPRLCSPHLTLTWSHLPSLKGDNEWFLAECEQDGLPQFPFLVYLENATIPRILSCCPPSILVQHAAHAHFIKCRLCLWAKVATSSCANYWTIILFLKLILNMMFPEIDLWIISWVLECDSRGREGPKFLHLQ